MTIPIPPHEGNSSDQRDSQRLQRLQQSGCQCQRPGRRHRRGDRTATPAAGPRRRSTRPAARWRHGPHRVGYSQQQRLEQTWPQQGHELTTRPSPTRGFLPVFLGVGGDGAKGPPSGHGSPHSDRRQRRGRGGATERVNKQECAKSKTGWGIGPGRSFGVYTGVWRVMIWGTWAAASVPLAVNPQAGQSLAIGKTSRQHSLTGVWHQTLAPPGSARLHAAGYRAYRQRAARRRACVRGPLRRSGRRLDARSGDRLRGRCRPSWLRVS